VKTTFSQEIDRLVALHREFDQHCFLLLKKLNKPETSREAADKLFNSWRFETEQLTSEMHRTWLCLLNHERGSDLKSFGSRSVMHGVGRVILGIRHRIFLMPYIHEARAKKKKT